MDEKNRRLVPLLAALGALVAMPSAAEEAFNSALVHVAAHSPTAVPGIESLAPLPTVLEIKDDSTPISTIDLTAQPDDLWERIRNGFAMPDLDSALVAKQQAYYLNHPQYLVRLTERSRRYLHHIVEEIEKRGMPMELALLPMVESAFNPMAYSRARASGLWQFIPSTGRNYQLKQDWWVDQRRDIVASTSAALDYLQMIYQMHGDWHLALASYNWGEGAVGRAIEKNRAKGLPTDYANLSMPDETRNYVPKLLALKNIVAQSEVLGVGLAPIPNQPYFATIKKPGDIDIALAAELAEMPVREFVALNPGFNRPVVTGQAKLVLPADKVETFLANLEDHDKPLVSWTDYTLKRGEKIDQVAARFGLSGSRLRQINGLGARTKLAAGRTLLVPKGGAPVAGESLFAALPPTPSEPEAAPASDRTKKIVSRGKHGKAVKVVAKSDSRSKTAKGGTRVTKVYASPKAQRTVAKATKSDAKKVAVKKGGSRS
ncbi:MAG: LysM repeat-containing protein [Proteobacteria bacterium]|nr:LysM repeat-containing protein [Pseudomonadota bacterium]